MRRAPLSAAAMLAVAALLVPLASAEVSQKRGVRVSVNGSLQPSKLPRHGTAPVAVSFSGEVGSTKADGPPQLEKISIAINRNGRLDTRGLPRCRMSDIDPSTTREAIAACRSSLIGDGSFSANVKLPEQSPFPSKGEVLAFNGRLHGRPAVFAHIFGTKPVPTSIVLPFEITSTGGTFGTVLTASLPRVTGEWGYVTGLAMTLKRQFSYRGKSRSYMSAGCPAPAGFRQVFFPLARTSFSFEGGLTVTSTLTRSCRVRG
ncbi:MAG TPA: hypothetical protein VNO20_09905 [Solirubrobacterales bacterium]|nr:hypothetical protein [Solirubrobacterales bacterium]